MTTAEPIETTRRPTRLTVARWVAWTLIAMCLALLASMVLAGSLRTSYGDLTNAVSAGQVDEVRVAGGLEDGHGRGQALAEVHWRRWLIPRVTQVYESTVRHSGVTYSSGIPTVRGRVDDQLRRMDPDLQTTRSGDLGAAELGFRITFGDATPDRGWQVPRWSLALGFAIFLGALWLLILGPEPHRATRWAWFWLSGVAVPLGFLAFLLLGGAAARRPTPAVTTDRLTGGWAFLLAFLLNSALATLVGFAF